MIMYPACICIDCKAYIQQNADLPFYNLIYHLRSKCTLLMKYCDGGISGTGVPICRCNYLDIYLENMR